MPTLNLVTYSLDGQRLRELTEARNISASVDALTFDLPVESDEYAYFAGDIAIALEVEELANLTYEMLTFSPNGEFFPRYIYRSSSESRDPENQVFSFTAPAIAEAVFPKWPIVVDPGFAHVTKYGPSDTPYTVIANRVAESQARPGANRNITVIDGGGWASETAGTSVEFNSYAPLSEFYNSLRDGKTADLFWVGTTLYVAAPGTMAADRSAVVEFQVDDFVDLPENKDRGQIADSIIGVGEGLTYLYPPEGPGDIEPVQFSGIDDTAVLQNLTQREWANRQDALSEVTGTLSLGSEPRLLFGRDYFTNSLVTIPTRDGGTEVVPVAQITVTRDLDPDLGGNVVFGRKQPTREVRIDQLLRSAVGGAPTILGNGSPVNQSTDTGWVELNTIGTFVPYSDANYQTLRARRIGNDVQIRGGVSNPGAAASAFAYLGDFTPTSSDLGQTNVGVDVAVFASGALTFTAPVTGVVIVHADYKMT